MSFPEREDLIQLVDLVTFLTQELYINAIAHDPTSVICFLRYEFHKTGLFQGFISTVSKGIILNSNQEVLIKHNLLSKKFV